MTLPTSKSADILELVNDTLDLPTMPEVLVKLNKVMADPDADAEDVAEVISVDPAVSANVLRLVNSAYYGLQVRVSSVSAAVSIMGFRMTKKVATKATVLSVFAKRREPIAVFDPSAFWRHSIFTGVAARAIGANSSVLSAFDPEDLYICGLLHDIGKIILLESATDRYVDVLSQAAASGRPELELEHSLLGFTHADVGSVLAIKWFMPEDLTIGVRYHHAPAKDPFHRSLSSLIHLADHIAWSSGNPSTRGTVPPRLEVEVYEQIGVEAQEVEDLLPQIHEDFQAIEMPW